MVLWAAVAASAVYWGLQLFVPGTPAPAHAAVAGMTTPPRGDLTRLLGADVAPAVAAAPTPSARFHLIGVVAPRSAAAAREGVALIAVDDKPARAYRVGSVIEGNTVLQAVRARGATLGPQGGPANLSLDIPPPAPAATGALPGVGAAPPAGVRPGPGPGMPAFGSPPRLLPQPSAISGSPMPQPADGQPDPVHNNTLQQVR